MEENEISIEVLAGMSASQMAITDLGRAIVLIANRLLEVQPHIKSGSGLSADGPDLTIPEIMADSRKSYATVYRWIQRGLLRRNHANRTITVRRKDYLAFKDSVTW